MNRSYYLGAAIDLSSDLNPFDVMSSKVIELDPECVIFRPDKAYNNAHKASVQNAFYLKSVNDHALLEADTAIFYISSKIFSMGAALEIQARAQMHERCLLEEIEHDQGKKTIVITDKAGLYLKIQHSDDLLIYIEDSKPLAEIDFEVLLNTVHK